MTSFGYTPDGSLQIVIPPASCPCGKAHPSSATEWDSIVRAANRWLADNAPVCRNYAGIEPWLRGEGSPAQSTSKLAVAVQPKVARSPGNKARSVFGCGECKRRKVKCDERRPVCSNCRGSSRRRRRECVYDFDVIDSGSGSGPTPGPGPGSASSAPLSTPLSIPSTASTELTSPGTADSKPTPLPAPAPVRPELAAETVSEDLALAPHPVDVAALARTVGEYGLMWFVEATEVTDSQFYYSDQRGAFLEHRQAVLERCWNAYIEYNGELLPEGLPDFSTLSATLGKPPPHAAGLVKASLLHAFVAFGATHLAYWSRRRGVTIDEKAHRLGAASLLQLSTNALLHAIPMEETNTEELQSLISITLCLQVTARIISADPLAPATLRLECDWVRTQVVPRGMTPITVEVVQVVMNDAIYSMIRGKGSWLKTQPDWLDKIDIAARCLTEGYGMTLPQGRFILETAAVLGLIRDHPHSLEPRERLRGLHERITNAIVGIYQSPHSPRVQIGDLLYRQALLCLLRIDGYNVPKSDPDLQKASNAILELFSEAVYDNIYTVRWMLPLLVAGGLAPVDRRDEVMRIFDAMADTCGCEDIEVARRWTQRSWEYETWRPPGMPMLFM